MQEGGVQGPQKSVTRAGRGVATALLRSRVGSDEVSVDVSAGADDVGAWSESAVLPRGDGFRFPRVLVLARSSHALDSDVSAAEGDATCLNL